MERPCDWCGKPYTAKRRESRYCSAVCRKRMHRNPSAALTPTRPDVPREASPPAAGEGVEAQIAAELAAAGKLDTHLGRIAVVLARSLDGVETATGKTAAAKELRAVMVEALRGGGALSRTDELRARRERRRAG